ncbi:MAG TPA: hypothetical protein PK819_15010, partial [Thermomicrobiales bacterium]|nr:hypothetical protein [Thermomicrobiales bacterium]
KGIVFTMKFDISDGAFHTDVSVDDTSSAAAAAADLGFTASTAATREDHSFGKNLEVRGLLSGCRKSSMPNPSDGACIRSTSKSEGSRSVCDPNVAAESSIVDTASMADLNSGTTIATTVEGDGAPRSASDVDASHG